MPFEKHALSGDINVTALDFDGCINIEEGEYTRERYLDGQKEVLAFLDKTKSDFILSGSSRTTIPLDKHNAVSDGYSPGASFNVFPWFETDSRKFLPFFLNDLFATHDDGTPYHVGDTFKIVKSLFKPDKWAKDILYYEETSMTDEGVHSPYLTVSDIEKIIWAKDKINIVYAHIHYLSSVYPNKHITYQLVDDTASILYAISYFYNKHPELIPRNVNIQLIDHWSHTDKFAFVQNQTTNNFKDALFLDSGGDIERKLIPITSVDDDDNKSYTIKGNGETDKYFRANVKLLTDPNYNPTLIPERISDNFFSLSLDVSKFKADRTIGLSQKATFPFLKAQAKRIEAADDAKRQKRRVTKL